MDISVKFRIDEEVYFYYQGELACSKVATIDFFISRSGIRKRYTVYNAVGRYDEKELFKTSEDFFNGLKIRKL